MRYFDLVRRFPTPVCGRGHRCGLGVPIWAQSAGVGAVVGLIPTLVRLAIIVIVPGTAIGMSLLSRRSQPQAAGGRRPR